MTIRFTSFPLIGTEIDVNLKERSNLSQSNYVKLAGFLFTVQDQLRSSENEI